MSQTILLMLLCIIEPSLFLTEAILVIFSLNLIFSFFHSFSHSFTSPPNFNYRIYLLNSAKLVNVPKINFGLCTRMQTLRICYNLSLQTCLERLDIKGNTCLHNVMLMGLHVVHTMWLFLYFCHLS